MHFTHCRKDRESPAKPWPPLPPPQTRGVPKLGSSSHSRSSMDWTTTIGCSRGGSLSLILALAQCHSKITSSLFPVCSQWLEDKHLTKSEVISGTQLWMKHTATPTWFPPSHSRPNCFFRHPVQFTLLQALAFKGEEYQFEGYKLENTTFFFSCLHPCISFSACLLHRYSAMCLSSWSISSLVFLKRLYIYVSLSTHVSAIVCHSWLFLLLSKEDNAVQWKRAHRWITLCCCLYDFFSDWGGQQMHVCSWCEESVEDQWRRPIYLNSFQTHSAYSQSSWTLTSIVRVTGTELRGKLDVYIFRRLLLGKQMLKPFRIHSDLFLLWINVTQVLLKRRLRMNQRNCFSSQCQSNIAYSIADLKVWNV